VTPLVPDSLRELPQWVLWKYEERGEGRTKVPYQIPDSKGDSYKADSTKPRTWTDFDLSIKYFNEADGFWDGIGFVFSPEDPYFGMDLDRCLADDGSVKPWAKPILERFADSYAEISPSGKGIKIWARGKMPGKGVAFPMGDGRVEIYDQIRFFTVTGNHWGGQLLDIEDHQKDLEWVLSLSPHGQHKVPFNVAASSANKIPKGQQYDSLVSFAGTLRARGADYAVIEAALLAMNREQCTEPGTDDDIRQIARNSMRWKQGSPPKPNGHAAGRDTQRDAKLQAPGGAPYTNGNAALYASAPSIEPPPDDEPEIDYESHLEAEIVRIIEAKDVFQCYKAPFIELCAKAGHDLAFIARERLRQAYPNPGGLILKGAPGAWDVRYKEEVDRQASLVKPAVEATPQSSWQRQLILTDKGKQVPCYENAALHAENSPDWMGVLGYNEFTAGHVVLEAGPYPVTAKPNEEIEDHFDTEVTRWFERRGLLVKPEVARRTVDRMARMNAFHPVRDYLNKLPPWDGTRRIGSWLIDYCRVSPTVLNEEDDPVPNIFAMEAGARFLISAVARIFRPGCKADHVLMLEGKTGIGKSTTVRILAGEEYFTDQLSDLGSKDASMQIRGIWIVEIAELHALSKSDRENAKKFVSQQFERFRLPYGKRLTKFERQCVFIGTTENSEWNTDERGARRFWPVLCEGPIDTEGIARDRDQLWAEAVARYKSGAKWHIYKPEVLKAAEEVQSSRYAVDVWQDKVIQQAETISRLPDSRRSAAIPEILSAMGVDTPRQDQLQANRVGRCLRFAKWERKQVREGAKRFWRWFPPSEPTPAE
jgi:predicted P-loop ATPase